MAASARIEGTAFAAAVVDGVARLQAGLELDRLAVRADVLRGGPVGLVVLERDLAVARRHARQGGGVAQRLVQFLVLGFGQRDARRVQRPGDAGEQPARSELTGGLDDRCRVVPDRLGQLVDQVGRVGRAGREVLGQQRRAGCGVGPGRRVDRAAEPAGLVTAYADRERAEHDDADDQRYRRPAHEPRRHPPPQARLAGARLGLARPERGPAEHRQQRGQQGEPGQQHGADPDGQRDAELGVDLEGGDEQRQQRRDDRQGGERDRLANPHDRRAHRVLGIGPLAQVLTHPEHQEQPVVGARAEDQHDQQQLGDDGDLQAGVRRLADQRSGDGHGEERGDQRDQWGQQ